MQENGRVRFIDGLRGIAIGAVVLFHAYARYPEVVPYGDQFGSFLIFKEGWLGVELFFVISGYVILMTLRRTSNFSFFMLKRWNRLFPAMFIATFIIYVTANLFMERPAGPVHLKQVLPGLFFINPDFIKSITGFSPGLLEGSFWSLFVEIKFYVLFGFLYYFLNEKWSLLALGAISATPAVANIFHSSFIISFCNNMELNFFPWFLIGALLYSLEKSHSTCIVYLILISCCLAFTPPIETRSISASFMKSFFLVALFATPFFVQGVQRLLSIGALTFLGFVSYPLYLIHENMMIALIVKLGRTAPFIPNFLLPLMPIIFVISVGFIIARWLEPLFREQTALLFARLCVVFGAKET